MSSCAPPPLPPRPTVRSTSWQVEPSSLVDDIVDSGSTQPAESILTERQLREQYEAEEIQHFLHLFSNHVNEVRATDAPVTVGMKSDRSNIGLASEDNVIPAPELNNVDFSGFAEIIASRFVRPRLPRTQPNVVPFTLGRLQQTSERIYIIVQSIYLPFITNLYNLSTWQDRKRSSLYCALYWILWWNNLLLPGLVFRAVCSLFRRKIFLYPTVTELRKRQEDISRAGIFGDQVATRLSSSGSSALAAKDMWRLFRLATHGKPGKQSQKHKGKGEKNESTEPVVTETVSEDITIIEDPADETSDVKRLGLEFLMNLADFHERVRNLFIWRRPPASRTYCMLLVVIFLSTLLIPAKYIVKAVYFLLGFSFWHIVPVFVALSPEDRNRLPPIFADIPTDAEYAMEIISLRVAEGLPITPAGYGKKRSKKPMKGAEHEKLSDKEDADDMEPAEWKKWSDRLNAGRSLAAQGKRLFTGRTDYIPEPDVLTHSFPAQHNTTTGLIDLSSTTLNFTPLMNQTAKLVIPLASLKGVKKTAILKGLEVSWIASDENGCECHKNEKFLWIGGRDELFARLISGSGRNWTKV